jgi:glucose-1-phosphate thymidylyltransferase
MQGILLAGGYGTRLGPVAKVVNKHLLPIFDKPMIYYPLTTMILAGVKEILLISTPDSIDYYTRLLKHGEEFGIKIEFKIQETPSGIPDAFRIAEQELDSNSPCTLILGDNFFYGPTLGSQLNTGDKPSTAICYITHVNNPENFGVVTFKDGYPNIIQEKPKNSTSNLAITGFYQFPENVWELSKSLQPSKRGETEITDLLREYLELNNLLCKKLPRGTTWLDTGSADGLLEASNFVSIIQNRQCLLVGSPHEAAWRIGNINKSKLLENSERFNQSTYGKQLFNLTKENAKD